MIFSSPEFVERLLIEDGVERNRGLAGLAVADDQLALPTPDGNERIDGLEPGGHRLVHGFARNDARRLHIDPAPLGRVNRPLAVERIAERVDDAPEQSFAHGDVHNGLRALDGLAFLDLAVIAENHDADIVGLEVERHAAHAILELDHLAGLHVVEPIHPGDAVADREDLSDLRDLRLAAEILDLLFEYRRDFGGADLHQETSFIACLIRLSLVRSELSTIRDPSLTTSPPRMDGSTFTST